MSVIETVSSRNGPPVLVKDGRFMGSSIDPMREAEQWLVKAQIALRQSGSSNSVIIFGLGSGYQAKMLAEVLGAHAILVVEPDAAVVEANLALHPELRNLNIAVAGEWMNLIENANFRDFACSKYTLLKNQVSVQRDHEFFAGVESLLLGRERLSFLLQLKMRPELYGVLDAGKIEKVLALEARELVSVKTLQVLFSAQARMTRERRIWKVLEELVV